MQFCCSYYKKKYFKHNQNDLSQVVPSDSGIQMKEKEMKEEEKAKPLPVVNPVAISSQGITFNFQE